MQYHDAPASLPPLLCLLSVSLALLFADGQQTEVACRCWTLWSREAAAAAQLLSAGASKNQQTVAIARSLTDIC